MQRVLAQVPFPARAIGLRPLLVLLLVFGPCVTVADALDELHQREPREEKRDGDDAVDQVDEYGKEPADDPNDPESDVPGRASPQEDT